MEGFLLHLSSADAPGVADWLLWIDSRAALMWVNEGPDEFGKEWQ
jgi:hypothetical protein